MTALADIGKAHLAVASLRGSDLTEFNEAHPRDAGGRFARTASAPVKDDPRIARMARLRRRQRRGAAETAGHQAAVAQAATDASALQGLRRERVLLPRRVLQVIDPRVKAKEETKEETKPKTPKPKAPPKAPPQAEIDDESYMNSKKRKALVRLPSVVFVSMPQAQEFLGKGSLVVTAAEKKWGTSLNSMHAHDAIVPGELMGSGLVAIRFQNPHWVDGSEEGMQEGRLAGAQSIQPLTDRKSASRGFTSQMNFSYHDGNYYADPKGRTTIRVIDANAWSAEELGMGLNKAYMSKAASLTDWDSDDHPRDRETGQFMRLHAGPGGPPSSPDPRVARERRRRRRQSRGLAEIAASRDVVEQEPSPRTLMDVRARTRSESAPRPAGYVLLTERPGRRHGAGIAERPEPVEDVEEPSPKPKRTRFIPAPGEGSYGGRVVTEEQFQEIEAAKKKAEPISNRTPSRSLSSLKRKATSERLTVPKVSGEIVALGAKPRFDLVDEYGNHTNEAELRAYAQAVRAARARKARSSTS